MKVLVTGAAGFIGSHVVDRLVDDGMEVVGLDSLDPTVHPRPPSYLRDDIPYVFEDLRHWSADADCKAVDAVIHLAAVGGVQRAARAPAEVISKNALGTGRLIKQARNWPNMRSFILMSSFSVYGNAYSYRLPDGRRISGHRRIGDLKAGRFGVYCPDSGLQGVVCPIKENTPISPQEVYGASKALQELCLSGLLESNIKVVLLRASSVVGPRMRWHDEDTTIIARLAGWLSSGQAPTLFEDGRQCRDWISVFDVAEAISHLLAGAKVPPVINVCSGVPNSMIDACKLLAGSIGSTIKPVVQPTYRHGDMRDCLGDATAISALLGRYPAPLEDTAASVFFEPNLAVVER